MDLPQRKTLPHEIPLWVDPQREIYFITINCQARGMNQLAKPEIAGPLLDSVRFRNKRFIWFAHLFLVMPDHVHALISFPQSIWVGTPGRAVCRDGGHLGKMSLPTNLVGTAGLSRPCGGHVGDVSLPTNLVGTAGLSRPCGGHVNDVSLPRNRAGTLQSIVTSWKRWAAKTLSIRWQRDFFEHRLRHEESRREKADYILANPVRKGLVEEAAEWPYVFLPNPIG